MLAEAGRKPGDVHRSMMTGCWYGRDEAAIQKRIDAHPRYTSVEEVRQRGALIGVASQLVDQIGELAEAGVQRIMLQWLDLDDIDGLEGIARDVMPQVAK